ncbi:MAG: bacillithiol biosynthesis deacetylase BshB1 [Gemmatimonadaceae bacterium]|nr:bacillithiol biosynthesis deacetylase BshB1 [Gemmatimonadaceae bacterium]MBA3657461.1 bacillithiol biosynthesis deacetylase BshB1 [Gemmatimonadaceae bacterium]
MTTIDVLAIAAHRDDVELICGGTMIKAAAQGHRTGVIDLTAGEMGSRGSAELRGEEASRAASVMGLSMRQNFGLPDSGITNTPEIRARLAAEIRKLKPTIVIAPALGGRHPDHREAAQLVRDACFMAGIKKVAPEVPPHRPRKVIHAITYREDNVKPTFVVDISDVFERKMEAIKCYGSQFDAATQAGEVYPNGEVLYDIVRHQAAHYGSLIRAQYGEPFHTFETMRVEDVMALEVSSF